MCAGMSYMKVIWQLNNQDYLNFQAKRSKMKRTIRNNGGGFNKSNTGQRTEWGYTGTHSIRKEAAPQRQAFAQAYFFDPTNE